MIARAQLVRLGLGPKAIRHRVSKGRLHLLWPGVYAVGRPEVTAHGRWMAAVLTCGDHAVLSHGSAAALWRIRPLSAPRGPLGVAVDVSVPSQVRKRRTSIRLHRRRLDPREVTTRDGIPVTSPARTLIDLATVLQPDRLEAAVNEADKLGVLDPEALRRFVDDQAGCHGVAALRALLDSRTFRLTDSELERRFLGLVGRAGLPPPSTRQRVNGFLVDFYWPELGLVVETDGLRYHRTPGEQAKDRIRDQAHTGTGLVPLRFTHAQVAYEPARVVDLLRSVAERQRLRLLAEAA